METIEKFAPIIALFAEPHKASKSRDEYIKELSQSPDFPFPLAPPDFPVVRSESIFKAVYQYLQVKILDHCPLTAAEKALAERMPEIDEEYILTVNFTDQLVDKAVERPAELSAEEVRTLSIVLSDKALDEFYSWRNFSDYERKAFALADDPLLLTKEEVSLEDMKGVLEVAYGYAIYDLEKVKERLYYLFENHLPISHREQKIIQKIHDFNINSIAY